MDDTLKTDPVFLGLTRPTVLWGVPQTFFALNLMGSLLAYVATKSFLTFFTLAPVLHGIGYLVCLKDIRTFDLWKVKARFLYCPNRAYWKATSYDPFQ